MWQFRCLYQSRAAVKDQRATNRKVVSALISNAQERVFQSVANTGQNQQVLVLVFFIDLFVFTPCANISRMCFSELIFALVTPKQVNGGGIH